jgi:hypothetical protein
MTPKFEESLILTRSRMKLLAAPLKFAPAGIRRKSSSGEKSSY